MKREIAADSPATTFAVVCGVLAPLVYIGSDLWASLAYPGYSVRDQAVSELFAIGAPTSGPVVVLFSLSSLLMVVFAGGLAAHMVGRAWRALPWLVLMNAIVSLVLWIFFPMHMRGVPPGFTDTMHGILATNPFPLLSIAAAAIGSRGWFRGYSVVTLVFVGVTALSAFLFVPAFLAHEPTPWMGIAERAGQYAHQLWHAVLAVILLRRPQRAGIPTRRAPLQGATPP